jgi:uncharacterized protein YbjQ (UPF0145 family)
LSNSKKDLTSIHDLEPFEHDLSLEEEFNAETPVEEDEDEVPPFDLPTEEEEENLDFSSTSEEEDLFSSPSDDETASFKSNFDEPQEDEEIPSFEEPVFSEPTFEAEEEEEEEEEEPVTETVFDTDPLPEPVADYYKPHEDYKTPETFQDVKEFAESSQFKGMSAEGNPSFSVLIKNVRFIEDVTDIMSLLRELDLLSDEEEQMKARLMRGTLLVPRISEYAAIYLAHKLRRFDIDISVGLSDEIHPPKHKDESEARVVSKNHLYQNQSHHFQFDDSKIDLAHVIVSATPSLEGYQVLRYLGVASEHKMVDARAVEDESGSEIPELYKELAQKLKAHAVKARANAVIGLNYQLTPLPSEFGASGTKYRVSCTGNLVWVNKL